MSVLFETGLDRVLTAAELARSIKLVRCVNGFSFENADVEYRRPENEHLDTAGLEHDQRAGASAIIVLPPGWTITSPLLLSSSSSLYLDFSFSLDFLMLVGPLEFGTYIFTSIRPTPERESGPRHTPWLAPAFREGPLRSTDPPPSFSTAK